MRRLDTLLGAGVGLVVGLALAWAGSVLLRDRAGVEKALLAQQETTEALLREVDSLRQEAKSRGQPSAQARPPVPADNQAAVPEPDLIRVKATAMETTPPRGKITRIDSADPVAVEVNLGTASGIAKFNSLEITRGDTAPEHIGTLRVFEVYRARALCRLVSTNPLKKLSPKVGDEVTGPRE